VSESSGSETGDVMGTFRCSSFFPTETGETFENKTPDQVFVIGTLANSGAFTIQIEGGKRNNSGLQIDVTGMEGDLKVSNPLSFANAEDNKVEGAQGDSQPLEVLPIPAGYRDLPASKLDASVLDLAYLYTAYANDRENGTLTVPTFADAMKMHKLIDLISEAASSGRQRAVTL
jgi:predicted dehydrogenase